ncbi:MAG: RtcB family protein [Firmicutes bacterium]|nr:RtcB family protein [Bacillota bacterium]
MLVLEGKYNSAKIFTDNVDQTAISQIIELCNQEFVSGLRIRIMPDVHAGAGCVIGTTITIKDKVVPNLVGVDIGCGMYTVKLGKISIDLEKLDRIINKQIPAGFKIRNKNHPYGEEINLSKLRCSSSVDIKRGYLSIGTLGGGNHFIEVNKDENDNLYLVVHSGSRNIGKQVADYYQNLAYKRFLASGDIEKLKIPKSLAYVEGKDLDNYLHDLVLMQTYAKINRKAIADTILEAMNLQPQDSFTTIHNYIDINEMILRKGAISAKKGERVLIPINMKDGSILAIGKGNPDWNYSAPHGAGRLMSRNQALADLDLQEFKEMMSDVYTTSIGKSTLDEAPMAYRPLDEILKNVQDSVEVVDVIKPIYNFKAH